MPNLSARHARALGLSFTILGAVLAAVAGLLALCPGVLPPLPATLALLAAVAAGGGAAALHSAWRAEREAGDALRARLARREGDVRAQAERIRRLDLHDAATGLLNARGLAAALAEALVHAESAGEPLALMLIELALPLPSPAVPEPERWCRRLGRAVQQAVRGSDVAGVLERNLLALLLPKCHDHRPAVRRLRASLEAAPIPWTREMKLAGIAIAPGDRWPDAAELIDAARRALDAARGAPAEAEVPVWPLEWGRTVVQRPNELRV